MGDGDHWEVSGMLLDSGNRGHNQGFCLINSANGRRCHFGELHGL
jgi:hypothetical protein